jgi:monovalent cation:H+ antiporter-2, CPA2 family
MPHAEGLTTIALELSVAVLGGLVLRLLKLPVTPAFILAGVVLGPTGLGFIENAREIEELADLGVLLLLFLIGMELRLQSFRAHLPVALGTTLVVIFAMTAIALLAARFTARETASALVIGFMLAISSTAVAIKMMDEAEEKSSPAGKLALAILVAQDLAVIPLLLITNALGGSSSTHAILLVALKLALSLALLCGLITALTRVKSFRFPFSEMILKDVDFGTLCVVGICFVGATLSGWMGLSPALGAFLAGLCVGHSTLRRAAMRVAEPVHSLLLFSFFLSVGLLIDLRYVWRELWLVALALLAVTGGKTLLNYGVLRVFRQKHHTAFLASLFMAPIGEFSFLLATTASEGGIMTTEGRDLAIAVVALSLLASPIWFMVAERAHRLAAAGLARPTTAPAARAARDLPGPGG